MNPQRQPRNPNGVARRSRADTRAGHIDVKAGQAILARRGECVRYSTLEANGAKYVAVCMPAISTELVRCDE